MQFRIPQMRAMYDTCRDMGKDRTSTFYVNGHPYRGAGHPAAYWNGRSGLRSEYVRRSLMHACWAAGRDDRREYGPVPFSRHGENPPQPKSESVLAVRVPKDPDALFVPLSTTRRAS